MSHVIRYVESVTRHASNQHPPNRFFVIVGVAAVGLDMAGLPLFGINTISEAVQPFLVMVIGGYLGLTASDLLWDHFYGT